MMPGGTKTATAFAVRHMLLGVWFETSILGLVGVIPVLVSAGVVARRVVIRACTSEEWLLVQPLLVSLGGFIVLGRQ